MRREKIEPSNPIIFATQPDFVAMTSLLWGVGLDISGFSFELKPLVDRIAANPEQLTDLAPFHPIEFNRCDYFVT